MKDLIFIAFTFIYFAYKIHDYSFLRRCPEAKLLWEVEWIVEWH